MTTWQDIAKGDRVVVSGREYTVTKIKPKGKRAAIKLTDKRGTYDGEVKLKDAVELVPLRDETGAQTRWATATESEATQPKGLEPCNAEQVAPPKVATGDLWDTPATKIEKRLDKLLGAVLVGETDDESTGWYVPPVDVTTVAAHLLLFHNVTAFDTDGVPANLMALHDDQHRAAATAPFTPMHVQHWHTKVRP